MRTPITLIAGFLGAGKTTLLNNLLAQGFGGRRVAVIVNDFGRVAIDSELIAQADEDMLTLRNGCVCCTLGADLVQGLGRLLVRPSYDAIIMETSGITLVKPLRALLESGDLGQRVVLERILVVADAVRYAGLRSVVVALDEQVCHADLVVLNRCDLASAEEVEASEKAVRSVHPEVPIRRAEYSRVSTADLLGLDSGPAQPHELPDGSSDPWVTCEVRFNQGMSAAELKSLIGKLPEGVERMKGFVRSGDGSVFLVERVGTTLSLRPWVQEVPAHADNLLVAIGRPGITEGLSSCFDGHARVEQETSATHELST